ncbi:hypothetical protein OQA88_13514 [Cercophora sp. LCS_1]
MAGSAPDAHVPANKPLALSIASASASDLPSGAVSIASSIPPSPATDTCGCDYPLVSDKAKVTVTCELGKSAPSKPYLSFPDVLSPDGRLRNFFFEAVPMGYITVVHIVFLPASPSAGCWRPQGLGSIGPQSLINKLLSQHTLPVVQALEAAGFLIDPNVITAFSLILPNEDGYVAHSNFVSSRLEGSSFSILRLHQPLDALEQYTAIGAGDDLGLPALVKGAAAVLQWEPCHNGATNNMTTEEIQSRLFEFSQELAARISSVQWILPEPTPSYRIALVRGRPNLMTGGEFYAAAKALGVKLVIIDQAGHWLQEDTEENKKYREGFIVTDMTEDDQTACRFVAAVKSYPERIDAIVTLSDNFFVAVAKANKALGFKTNPVSSYKTSVNKYRSRLLQDEPGKTARVDSVAELKEILSKSVNSRPVFSPDWPMIVKPTKGWSSECVSKVSSIDDLYIAVQKATNRHGSSAVIEPFFEGPEIDANFILHDGEMLFSEIADEPPCSADANNATVHDTFSPVALTMPSSLPSWEQQIVKNTLRDLLVKAGFRTGVFHVEARMTNSSVEYRQVRGVVDLYPSGRFQIAQPVCRLVEINARPPGYRVTVPARITNGVDYFVAHILAAVGDYQRLHIFSQPFRFGPTVARTSPADFGMPGASSWTRLVYVPAPRDGVIGWPAGVSPGVLLKQRDKNVLLAVDYGQAGDKVSAFTDGAETVLGHVLVRGKTRQDAIEAGKAVLRGYYQYLTIDGKLAVSN